MIQRLAPNLKRERRSLVPARPSSCSLPTGFPCRFREALHRAGVPAGDHRKLWKLHEDAGQRGLEKLLADHAHWRLYLQSRRGCPEAGAAFAGYWLKEAGTFFRSKFGPQDAEDLTSIFFERVYRLVGDTFEWRCRFQVYLRAILVNVARDHVGRLVKQRQREVSLDVEVVDARQENTGRPQEEALLMADTAGRVRDALRGLPSADGVLVTAWALECEPTRWVASRLGLSPAAAYQRIHRAKRRLKRVLSADRHAVGAA